jgi:hypothetical protein
MSRGLLSREAVQTVMWGRPRGWRWARLPLALAGAAVVLVVVACGGGGGANGGRQHAPGAHLPTVACDTAIGQARSGHQDGYRVVLGVVSVPPSYLGQSVPVRGQRWRHWQKAGLLVRTGSPAVVVSVSKAWQHRAAITWGSSGTVSSLRVARCLRPPRAWSAWAGGFYLRFSSGCIPLVFRVGRRSATVRFGIGRRCR